MKKERLPFLDLIKAVAIILVVFCHYVMIPSESFLGNVGMRLMIAAVPCFFMCSGYILLFKEESINSNIKRFVRMYLVMVVWKVLYLVFYSCVLDVKFGKLEFVQYLFLFGEIENVTVAHLWFIQGYLLCLLIRPIFVPFFSDRRMNIVFWAMGLVLFSSQLPYSGQFIFDHITNSLGVGTVSLGRLSLVAPFSGEYTFSLFFFLMGGCLRDWDNKGYLDRKNVRIMGPALLITGLAGLMIVKYLKTGIWLWGNWYFDGEYKWFSTIIMAVGLFLTLRGIGDTKIGLWLGHWLGKNTMGIFYLHWPLTFFIYHIHLNYQELPIELWFHCVKTIAVVIVSVIITSFCKKIPVIRKIFQ